MGDGMKVEVEVELTGDDLAVIWAYADCVTAMVML